MFKKIFILFIVFISTSIMVFAEESNNSGVFTSATPYSIFSDGAISHDSNQGIFHASGDVRFESADISIIASDIIVYSEENLVKAEGSPLIIKIGNKIYEGDALQFNYMTRSGSVSGVSTDIEELSVSGENVLLTRDENLMIDDAEITPCVFPDPHYSIKASMIKVFPEEKIVARGVWFYFSGQKVFYLPSYTVEYDENTGKYDNISFLTDIGYNSEDGIYLTLKYKYEYTDRFQGEINGLLNQYGEKDVEMENSYKVTDTMNLINLYTYKEEEDDDGNMEITNQLSGGIRYSHNDLDISTTLKHDFVKDSNSLEIDTEYHPGPYKFSYFRKYTETEQTDDVYSEIDLEYNPGLYKLSFHRGYNDEELSKELYTIRYNSTYPVQLQYKKGYTVDYLPYLSIERLDYKYAGIHLNSSLGLGKVANGDIFSSKVALNLDLDKQFRVSNDFKINLYGQMRGNYYLLDDLNESGSNGYDDHNNSNDKYYNHYLIGINTELNSTLTERLNINYGFSYNYSWDTGNPYLPEDKIDTKETIRPSLTLNYKFDEHQSFLRFNIQGKYDFIGEDLNELNLKLTRELDCYSYYLGYDVINKGYELGIDFDI